MLLPCCYDEPGTLLRQNFLQARCPSCHLTNTVKALKASCIYCCIPATFPPEEREHSPLHNGLGLTPTAAVHLARRHARPINALGDDQPTLSALYYDLLELCVAMENVRERNTRLWSALTYLYPAVGSRVINHTVEW